MNIDENIWKFMQNHLGYTDEEMKIFRDNPRNQEIISGMSGLMSKTIIAEVVESRGCNSQHKKGDRLYFDGGGNLLTKQSPKKICIYALKAVAPLIYASNELFYAGVDPNKLKFNRTGCQDVGVQCGGWGNIVLELKVEDRK